MQRWVTGAAALLVAGCGGGGGGGPTATPPTPGVVFTDPVTYTSGPLASLASADEITAVTRHQLALGGVTLNYTASAGHLTAHAPGSATPEASFFYVAYTLDGRDAATRPVTFFYNGGPGSATVWLHLGSFGPKRLVASAPSTTAPTPFPLADNANNRAASPKFLFGESYGTARSAVLANLLESAGVSLKGVVLQSSVLNYNNNCGLFDAPKIACTGFVPTYAAVGAWFNLDVPNPSPANLAAFIADARIVAGSRYDPAVRQFLSSATAPDTALLTQLASSTGMPVARWQARFNMDATSRQPHPGDGARLLRRAHERTRGLGARLLHAVQLRVAWQRHQQLEFFARRPGASRYRAGPRRGHGAQSQAQGLLG